MRMLSMTLVLFLLPRLVFAELPPPPAPLIAVPPGADTITAVRKGDAAPYDGQLFDQATAIRWANYLQQSNARLRLDPLYQYKLDQIDLQALQKTIDLERTEYARVTKELNTKLLASEKAQVDPPFYSTFWFGMTVGVVVSVLLVGGAAVALNAVR